jgi:hypothetical protein
MGILGVSAVHTLVSPSLCVCVLARAHTHAGLSPPHNPGCPCPGLLCLGGLEHVCSLSLGLRVCQVEQLVGTCWVLASEPQRRHGLYCQPMVHVGPTWILCSGINSPPHKTPQPGCLCGVPIPVPTHLQGRGRLLPWSRKHTSLFRPSLLPLGLLFRKKCFLPSGTWWNHRSECPLGLPSGDLVCRQGADPPRPG